MRPIALGLVVAAAALSLLSPSAARAAGPEDGEVVVSVWNFVAPGLSEKRGCRIRVVIENRTPVRIGFSGKFRTLQKGEEKDTWFVATTRIAPGASVERLFSCVTLAESLELDRTSNDGYPRVCESEGEDTSPCPYKMRLVSNLKLVGP